MKSDLQPHNAATRAFITYENFKAKEEAKEKQARLTFDSLRYLSKIMLPVSTTNTP